jgi:HPt (histidine-containing phosphotransfer) domain-containing protein
MSGGARDRMSSTLDQLRSEYTEMLPSRLAALREALAGARLGGLEQLHQAKVQAHRMYGTAGMFGHRVVGDAARRIEEVLEAMDQQAGSGAGGGLRDEDAWREIERLLAELTAAPRLSP